MAAERQAQTQATQLGVQLAEAARRWQQAAAEAERERHRAYEGRTLLQELYDALQQLRDSEVTAPGSPLKSMQAEAGCCGSGLVDCHTSCLWRLHQLFRPRHTPTHPLAPRIVSRKACARIHIPHACMHAHIEGHGRTQTGTQSSQHAMHPHPPAQIPFFPPSPPRATIHPIGAQQLQQQRRAQELEEQLTTVTRDLEQQRQEGEDCTRRMQVGLHTLADHMQRSGHGNHPHPYHCGHTSLCVAAATHIRRHFCVLRCVSRRRHLTIACPPARHAACHPVSAGR